VSAAFSVVNPRDTAVSISLRLDMWRFLGLRLTLYWPVLPYSMLVIFGCIPFVRMRAFSQPETEALVFASRSIIAALIFWPGQKKLP